MKRNYILLSIFLALGVIIIVISGYIARQSLREITREEKKLQIQATQALQPTISPRLLEEKEESFATKPAEANKPKEPEFADLSQIPDEYFEEIERKGESQEAPREEVVSAQEQKLNKYPDIKELKELKSKGAVIY